MRSASIYINCPCFSLFSDDASLLESVKESTLKQIVHQNIYLPKNIRKCPAFLYKN